MQPKFKIAAIISAFMKNDEISTIKKSQMSRNAAASPCTAMTTSTMLMNEKKTQQAILC